MLEANIIRKSSSPWSAPVLVIKKDDGPIRVCVDYRELNKVTVSDLFPMRRIDDVLDRLQGSKYFTRIDLKSGYWQIAIHPEDITKTAFSTNDGHYEFIRMPFGLKNAPAEFNRVMRQVFANWKNVEVYMDDIIIHTKTMREHLELLDKVLKRLREVKLKASISKLVVAELEIKVLGHVISQNQVKMDPKKIEAVEKWSTLSNVKQVQRFLGLCGYYRRFVKDYAKIAAPLNKLLRKDVKWNWDGECDKAFKELKDRLISYPILRQPDPTRKFIIHTDASGVAIGAVLAQLDEYRREYVCQYASKSLRGAELHYGITEKECLAVVLAVRHFRVYVYGVEFDVVTDHTALKWLMDIKEPTGRLARWAMYLQAYKLTINYRKGRKHQNADALSRMPVVNNEILAIETDDEEENEENISPKTLDPYEDELLLQYLRSGEFTPGMSQNQKKRVLNNSKYYTLEEGRLYYNDPDDETSKTRIVPRKEEEK